MIKNLVSFEAKVNEQVGYFYLSNTANTAEAKEMLFQFQKLIGQIEDQARLSQEQQAAAQQSESIVVPIEPEQEVKAE